MKAQDLVILLKIIIEKNKDWKFAELAEDLYLSPSEISKATSRLQYAGLLDETKRVVSKKATFDLIKSSLQYIFPVKPGALAKGIPTAHSHSPLNKLIRSNSKYVLPSIHGTTRGESIEPLYKNLDKAIRKDKKLHEMIALIDSIRVGKTREQKIAVSEIEKRILGE